MPLSVYDGLWTWIWFVFTAPIDCVITIEFLELSMLHVLIYNDGHLWTASIYQMRKISLILGLLRIIAKSQSHNYFPTFFLVRARIENDSVCAVFPGETIESSVGGNWPGASGFQKC